MSVWVFGCLYQAGGSRDGLSLPFADNQAMVTTLAECFFH